MMKSNRKTLVYVLGFVLCLSLNSCDSLVDADPPADIVTTEEAYTNANTARAVANGLYTENLLYNALFYYEIPFYLTVLTDDAYHVSTSYDELKNNTYTPTSVYTAYFWSDAYKAIFYANDIINTFEEITVLPEEEKQKYIGEAKYFRAYSYFILTSLYGDVPYVESTKILETTLQGRDSKEFVVQKIIQDLKDAEIALANSSNTNSKVTKWAASALLARQYLYSEKWNEAEKKANEVIISSGYKLEKNIEDVFLRTSKETIFRTSSSASWSSYVDRIYFAQLAGNANYLRFTNDFVNSFESDADLRKQKWTIKKGTTAAPYYQQNKYRRIAATSSGSAEDFVSLRLGEQFLIRAEARAQQNLLTGTNGAIADLDSIRIRANLPALSQSLTKPEVLLQVEKERRSELFLEEAHRWWDLVRTGRADDVLTGFENKQWKSYKSLLPVPEDEIDLNKNLAPNNPGYGDL